LNPLIYVAITVAVGIGVCFLLGYVGVAPFDSFTNMVSGWIGNFNIGSVASNPATLLTSAGAAVAVAVPLISKISSTKQQAQQALSSTKAQAEKAEASLTNATSKLDSTTLDLEAANKKIADLQTAANAAPAQIAQLQKEKENLTVQLQALNNIQAKAVVLAENKEVVRTVVK
jgi:DNA repair ATPase RecN